MIGELKNFQIHENFKYLWLKYVTGVNLDVHCARCLVGEYSTAVKKDVPEIESIKLDEFKARIFYLCGVHISYKWELNFHCAFEIADGDGFTVSEQGISFRADNLRRIPITTEAIEIIGHPRKNNKAYSTCRNWQFANQLRLRPELLSRQ